MDAFCRRVLLLVCDLLGNIFRSVFGGDHELLALAHLVFHEGDHAWRVSGVNDSCDFSNVVALHDLRAFLAALLFELHEQLGDVLVLRIHSAYATLGALEKSNMQDVVSKILAVVSPGLTVERGASIFWSATEADGLTGARAELSVDEDGGVVLDVVDWTDQGGEVVLSLSVAADGEVLELVGVPTELDAPMVEALSKFRQAIAGMKLVD
jgi:hypothetical protein